MEINSFNNQLKQNIFSKPTVCQLFSNRQLVFNSMHDVVCALCIRALCAEDTLIFDQNDMALVCMQLPLAAGNN